MNSRNAKISYWLLHWQAYSLCENGPLVKMSWKSKQWSCLCVVILRIVRETILRKHFIAEKTQLSKVLKKTWIEETFCIHLTKNLLTFCNWILKIIFQKHCNHFRELSIMKQLKVRAIHLGESDTRSDKKYFLIHCHNLLTNLKEIQSNGKIKSWKDSQVDRNSFSVSWNCYWNFLSVFLSRKHAYGCLFSFVPIDLHNGEMKIAIASLYFIHFNGRTIWKSDRKLSYF